MEQVIQVEHQIQIHFQIFHLLLVAILRIDSLRFQIFTYRILSITPVSILLVNTRNTRIPTRQTHTTETQTDTQIRIQILSDTEQKSRRQTLANRQMVILFATHHTTGKRTLYIEIAPERGNISRLIVHFKRIHHNSRLYAFFLCISPCRHGYQEKYQYYLFHPFTYFLFRLRLFPSLRHGSNGSLLHKLVRYPLSQKSANGQGRY